MAPTVPPLSALMVKDWLGGLRWETKGYKGYDDKDNRVHQHRNLLHHRHSTHIAKTLVRNLATKSRPIISRCLADIYNNASERVHLCDRMEPEQFWAYEKNSWEWSQSFNDEAFWAFTHKLFLARALYLDTVPEGHRSRRYPLPEALDLFRDRFYARYGPGVISGSIFGTHPSQGELDKVQKKIFAAQKTRDTYFQYSQVDSEGDGSDRLKSTVVQDDRIDPNREKYYWWDEVHVEPTEDIVAYYFDLGLQNPRHGHKDAYQEIEDALKQAEEEEEREKLLDKERTGLEDDLMMVDVSKEDDCIGDMGMGGLEM
ncbi:hypothetical protein F5B22DRAFT_662628 [Xylaria bambusicola]|uniref:uncharacterized protein n=1 Tax=Xylaria bambusicola TaxID=326684 RepID=UPI00200765B5|nr:uncharacterized protein F5B22DRAFT_662628 [Xylaria bambusicola]KAI0503069.1 hypothetical protein F5B22DRAFT_662628 [Xylaria bambusicola]